MSQSTQDPQKKTNELTEEPSYFIGCFRGGGHGQLQRLDFGHGQVPLGSAGASHHSTEHGGHASRMYSVTRKQWTLAFNEKSLFFFYGQS